MNDSVDYVSQLIYGPGAVLKIGENASADVSMDDRLEGWIGIPHGGISMGIMMDLVMALDGYPHRGDQLYPLSADFRFGGTSIRIGELLHFDVKPVPGGAEGNATVDHKPDPYLSSSIRYKDNSEEHGKAFSAFMPEKFSPFPEKLIPLPSYKNCFVCGNERKHPGLERQFYLRDTSDKIVVSPIGFSSADRNSFYQFSRNRILHPLPILALLDEILGWGGFLLSGSGAVTVRIGFTFYRPVGCNEKLVFFGRGDRVRGRASSRLIYWASGGAASVRENGSLEMIVSASGQWFGIKELTRQMRSSLLPKTSMERVFELATPSVTSRSDLFMI